MTVVMAIILGLGFLTKDLQPMGDYNDLNTINNKIGLFYTLNVYITLTSLFGVLNVFPMELQLFRRENVSGAMSVSAYYSARVIAGLPYDIFLPALFATITYLLSFGLERERTAER